MSSEDGIPTFLRNNFPENDSILIGCRADLESEVHDFCEYNIISLSDHNLLFLNPQFHAIYGHNRFKKVLYEVILLSVNDFYRNSRICYSEYVSFLGSSLRRNSVNHFERKRDSYLQSLKFKIRSDVIKNIYDITALLNLMKSQNSDEKINSLNLKIISLRTLQTYLLWFLKKEIRPSHIRSQIRLVLDNEPIKVREIIISLLDIVGTERANISTLSRSETSFRMFLDTTNQSRKPVIFEKIGYFKKQSMYVDALLMIYHLALEYCRGTDHFKRYPEMWKRTLDVSNKEKIILLKEVDLLLNFNKNLL